MNRTGRFDVREKAGAFIAAMLVWLAANLAAAFLLNLPRAERAASLRRASETFEDHLSKRQERVGGLKVDYDRVMDGTRTLATFYNDVLSTKRHRMTAVQKEIRDIAERFHIRPESIAYSRDIFDKDQIVKFTAVLPLSGSYENLRAFLNALERSENFLIIESVSLADSKEGGVILGLNVSVTTYFFDPDVKPKGAGESRRL